MKSPIAEYLLYSYGGKHAADIKERRRPSSVNPDHPGEEGFRICCETGYALFRQWSQQTDEFPGLPNNWLPGSHPGRVALFYSYRQDHPKGRLQSFFQKLLRMEMIRLASLLHEDLESTGNDDDCTYRVTLTIRRWMDYLLDCRRMLKKVRDGEPHRDREHETLLITLKRMLAALICDTSYRYQRYLEYDTYTPETLYPELLDEPVPDPPEVISTPHSYLWRMVMSVTGDGGEETPGEIVTELTERAPLRFKCAGADVRWWEETAAQIENIRFLELWQGREFMQKHASELMDPTFSAEWVQGLAEEIREEATDEDVLKKCWRVLDARTPSPDLSEQRAEEGGWPGLRSEARKLTQHLEQADRTLFSEPPDAGKKNADVEYPDDIPENPLAEKLLETFIPRTRLSEYLGLTSKATMSRFLENDNVRYVELTPQKHLIYTEDVEEIIKKRTKKYGKGS
ncbi:MAG: hypothetical protein GVY02_01160 [Bacteroidetes bacterium]|jgi:hypothetical protein|nr:hypothetical protein [Bacteroidota bacterium]